MFLLPFYHQIQNINLLKKKKLKILLSAYVTHNATEPMFDITWRQISLQPQKALYYINI